MGMIVLCAVYAQIYRYRHVSTPTERQQTKWVLFGFLLWLVLMGILGVPYSIEMSLPSGSPLPWWSLVGSAGWWVALTIVPLSLSIAVLRYHLYDIDVLINRTLVYGSLTIMLALVYFGGVTATQAVLQTLTGREKLPQLAIVVSTLLIAALFTPFRHRIQSFSAKLRTETDLDALSD